MNSLSFPDTRGALRVVRQKHISSDSAAGLVNPPLRLSSTPVHARVVSTPSLLEQTLPALEDIRRWQTSLSTDKRIFPEHYAESPLCAIFSRIQRPTPRKPKRPSISLSLPTEKPLIRRCQSSLLKVIPVQRLPPTRAGPWQHIDPSQDSQLGDYLVSAPHAFKTDWIKHNSLKHRKFDPATHPEFTQLPAEYHRLRTRDTLYREALLRVKAMLSKS